MSPSKDRENSPLGFMERLSPWVLYHDPKLPSNPAHPSLILINSWMGAQPAHIAKYTAEYQRCFSTSRILLITYGVGSLFSYSHHERLRCAVEILRDETVAAEAEGSGDKVRMLFHLFSNGGAANTRFLIRTSREINQASAGSGNSGKLLIPKHVLVMDSSPGYFHWMRAYDAMAQVVPWWVRPLIHFWILVGYVFWVIPRRQHYFTMNPKALRDRELLKQQTRRLYLYGTGDKMVSWRDVEDDAETVRVLVAKGEVDGGEGGPTVRLEKFEGSNHVSHSRTDFDRYWAAIEKLWEEREAERR